MKVLVTLFVSLVLSVNAYEKVKTVKKTNNENNQLKATKKDPSVIFPQETFLENLKKTDFPENCKLKNVIIGDENAPNTVIICSSFSCSHCREFNENVLPEFVDKYVKTGKAKVYFKFYIDDPAAFEAATLVRCLGGDSTEMVIYLKNKLYKKQEEWLKSKKPKEKLRRIFVDFGYNINKIKGCIADKKIGAGIMNDQKEMVNAEIYTIPAFIINGKVYQGKLTAEEIAEKF